MRNSLEIADPRTPTSWLLMQAVKDQLGAAVVVGQEKEGDEWTGLVHLAVRDDQGISAAVCIYDRVRDNGGERLETKVIGEDEQPHAKSYPVRLLDMLSAAFSPAAEHWRECCRSLAEIPALDDRPVQAGDYVFLARPMNPSVDFATSSSLFRCVRIEDGFADVANVDTVKDAGSKRKPARVSVDDLRRSRYPVSPIRHSVAHELRRLITRPLESREWKFDNPSFGEIAGGRCWELDGQAWQLAGGTAITEVASVMRARSGCSDAILLTFRSVGKAELLRVEVAFGPSGEAVIAEVRRRDHQTQEFARELELWLNVPPEPDPFAHLYGLDRSDDDTPEQGEDTSFSP